MLAAATIATALAATYLLSAIGLGAALALPSAEGHPPAWVALVPLAAAGLALLAWQQGGALRDRLYVRAMRLSRPRPMPHWNLGGTPAAPTRTPYARRPATITEGGAA
jgi:hypothetical protein